MWFHLDMELGVGCCWNSPTLRFSFVKKSHPQLQSFLVHQDGQTLSPTNVTQRLRMRSLWLSVSATICMREKAAHATRCGSTTAAAQLNFAQAVRHDLLGPLLRLDDRCCHLESAPWMIELRRIKQSFFGFRGKQHSFVAGKVQHNDSALTVFGFC